MAMGFQFGAMSWSMVDHSDGHAAKNPHIELYTLYVRILYDVNIDLKIH